MTLKIAIVGCGKIADGHIEEIQKMPAAARVVAVADLELPMLSPGIKINTSPDNYFLIRQLQLARFNGEMWEPFGELISG